MVNMPISIYVHLSNFSMITAVVVSSTVSITAVNVARQQHKPLNGWSKNIAGYINAQGLYYEYGLAMSRALIILNAVSYCFIHNYDVM